MHICTSSTVQQPAYYLFLCYSSLREQECKLKLLQALGFGLPLAPEMPCHNPSKHVGCVTGAGRGQNWFRAVCTLVCVDAPRGVRLQMLHGNICSSRRRSRQQIVGFLIYRFLTSQSPAYFFVGRLHLVHKGCRARDPQIWCITEPRTRLNGCWSVEARVPGMQ